MRKTKIICTTGPKTANFETLQQLAKNGMNVARLNMSHGTHSWHSDVIKSIKTINKKTGNPVAVGRAVAQLQQKHLIKEGDRVIVLSDILADGKFIETVQVLII